VILVLNSALKFGKQVAELFLQVAESKGVMNLRLWIKRSSLAPLYRWGLILEDLGRALER
jgi:hypothetical protein